MLLFGALFEDVAQFSAGMLSFQARDGLASAMHGMWGSFWIAYGLFHVTKAR
jgi:succinate-acetate transporter protein